MLKILDYGLGNIKAFINAYRKLDIPVESVNSLNQINISDKLILPGVGHFDDAMIKLKNTFNVKELENIVLNNSTPILGICVGMQILAKFSEEGGENGLGWIDTSVIKIPGNQNLILPHMGWNKIKLNKKSNFLSGIDQTKNRFYFLHSYVLSLSKEITIATSEYNIVFPTIIQKNNIYGIQCHPEKSHDDGLKILENFSNL